MRESIADFARVISQYVDVLAVRTFAARDGRGAGALHADDPDHQRPLRRPHPCQALADVLTIQERSAAWRALKLVFVGDGNNVARSLA